MPPKRKTAAGAAAAAAAAAGGGGRAAGGADGLVYRHCFLQAIMGRQYLKESDAKELYRQITGAAHGAHRRSRRLGQLEGTAARVLRCPPHLCALSLTAALNS